MSDYGLTVYNNNGGLMFDTRRDMNSYVVTEVGTGNSVSLEGPETSGSLNLGEGDFLFVAIPSGQASAMSQYVIFLSFDISTLSVKFTGYPIDTGGAFVDLTLDYFVVKHAKNVTSTDTHGLVVYNDDSTIQFDSRAVKTGNHFTITSYTQPNSTIGWTPTTGGVDLGDPSDYWEISWSSGTSTSFEGTYVRGIRLTADPLYYNYNKVTSSSGGEGFGEGGFGGGSTTTTETYSRDNPSMILSAELV